MKDYIKPILIVLAVLILDQFTKILVKTQMYPGEEIQVISDWFIIHFTENNGMAFGFEFAGRYGKLFLTLFRIIAVIGIGWYTHKIIREKVSTGLVICLSLVMAGALGNIIDSVFYGVMFGYESFFHGRVVDMLYFPIIRGTYPEWFPINAGESFLFFRPVFNLADTAISTGVISILVFQKRFFKETDDKKVSKKSS